MGEFRTDEPQPNGDDSDNTLLYKIAIRLWRWIYAGTESPSVTMAAGTAAIGSTTDGGAAWTTVFGVAGARFTSADQSAAVASVTDAPTTGQKLVITDIEISVDTEMRVDFKEETTGTVILSIYMAANSTVPLCTRSKRKLATTNKKLQVQTSVAGNISVGAFYYSEA